MAFDHEETAKIYRDLAKKHRKNFARADEHPSTQLTSAAEAPDERMEAVPCLPQCHYAPRDPEHGAQGVPEPVHHDGCPHYEDRYIHALPKVPED